MIASLRAGQRPGGAPRGRRTSVEGTCLLETRARRASAAIVLALSLGRGAARRPPPEGDWIGAWSASPQPDWGADFFAPVGIPRSLRDQTIRQVARVSLGGEQVRVELSNEYGDLPMTVGAATHRHGRRRRRGRRHQAGDLRRRSRRRRSPPARRSGATRSTCRSRRSTASRSASTCPRSPRRRPGTTTARQTAWIGAGDQTAEASVKADRRPPTRGSS